MKKIRTKLTGVLVEDAQKNIRELEKTLERLETAEATLSLIREPENKFDSNAIRVEADGKYLGYIPRETAKTLAGSVDEGSQFVISQSWLNKSPVHEVVGLTVEITEVL